MREITAPGVVVGALGMLVLIAVIVVVLLPVYSDYTGRARTNNMLDNLLIIQSLVELEAARSGSLAGVGDRLVAAQVVPGSDVAYVRVLSNGEIFGRSPGTGSVVLLLPTLFDSRIEWECIGGPRKDMPVNCRQN